MLVEIITQQEESIEVELPCYVQYGKNYHKIISKDSCITVKLLENIETSVSDCSWSARVAFGNKGWKFITEQEFNDALETAMNRLRNLQPASQL